MISHCHRVDRAVLDKWTGWPRPRCRDFPGRRDFPDTANPPRRFELTWKETGGPKIDTLTPRGFGTELIERGIRFELQGEATLQAVDGGLNCRIIIPANPQYITFGSPPDRPVIEEAAS